MTQVADILRDLVSGLKIPLKITKVEAVTGGYKLFTCNTQYLNTNMSFKLGVNSYIVLSFEPDTFLIVKGSVLPVIGTYLLAPPYYTHGKYEAVNKELTALKNPITWNPLLWMFELNDRDTPTEYDSRFESTGDVRLFLMNISEWRDFDTDAHYKEVIRPVSKIADLLKASILRYSGLDQLERWRTTNHAKFTTGGDKLAVGGRNVLGETQSGIEIVVNVPVLAQCSSCINH